MKEDPNPLMFIGSSSEGLRYARAVQAQFANDPVQSVVWDQDAFALNHSFLKNLDEIATKYDFGVFVLTADDILQMRGKRYAAPRDNVLFEYGLFVGRKGIARSFLICPKAGGRGTPPFRVPSDLAGIHFPRYEDVPPGGEIAALGPACIPVRQQILAINRGALAAPADRLDRIVGMLSDVARGLATTSLGRFPAFYPNINQLLTHPMGRVRVACDFLTYGIFTAPEEYDRYIDRIEATVRAGIPVAILHLNRKGREELLAHQIGGTQRDFGKLLKQPAFIERLARFERRVGRRLRTRSTFVTAVHNQQAGTVKLLRSWKGVSLRETGRSLKLFIWIEDDEHAVFSIPRFGFGDYAAEHGFVTRDTSLVRTLVSIWEQAWQAR